MRIEVRSPRPAALRRPLEVQEIRLRPGQYLTVWLDREPELVGGGEGLDAVQVELRVRPDGVREIFISEADGNVSVRDSNDWRPMQGASWP